MILAQPIKTIGFKILQYHLIDLVAIIHRLRVALAPCPTSNGGRLGARTPIRNDRFDD